ncbi:zinc-ribbon domain-containing protein [Alkalihalophilus marmarensis]|uniref:zinc-ribbon domain-containing protein n=1 Tax=Alkalihalophilus marmarensis TaxID=521377 RepID=UPI002DBAE8EF|nr:DUF6583 family protein [Alkalihalophilus marmarensis]MEC2073450.1 zinc-ribbon domain-containing protein [Alkalihalophilus marmarensis]
MVCKNCGAALKQDATVCPSCGTEVDETAAAVALEYEETEHRPPSETAPPKKSKKKAIIITSAVAVLLMGFAALAFGMGLFMSDKQRFLYAEYKSFEQLSEELQNKYGEDLAFNELTVSNPSRSEVTLSGMLNMDAATYDPDLDMIQTILNSSSITMTQEMDPVVNQAFYELGLNIQQTDALTIEMIQSNEQMGLKVPFLYDEYFYINLDQYGDFMRMFDPFYDGIESLESAQYSLEDYKLSEAEQEALQSRYSTFFMDSLKDEYFTDNGKVDYEHSDTTLSLRELVMELSPEEASAFSNEFFEFVAADDELHQLIAERIVMTGDAETFEQFIDLEEFNVETIQADIKEVFEDLKADAANLQFPNGFTSTILVDNSNIVVNRQINTAISTENTNEAGSLMVETRNVELDTNEVDRAAVITFAPEGQQDSELNVAYTNLIGAGDGSRTEDMNLNVSIQEFGTTSEPFSLSMQSEFFGLGTGEQQVERTFAVMSNDISTMEPLLTGTLNQEKDVNLKDETASYKYDFTIDLNDQFENGSLSVVVESDSTIIEEVSLPTLDGDEGINIVELTQMDMMQITQDIEMRLGQLMYELGLF